MDMMFYVVHETPETFNPALEWEWDDEKFDHVVTKHSKSAPGGVEISRFLTDDPAEIAKLVTEAINLPGYIKSLNGYGKKYKMYVDMSRIVGKTNHKKNKWLCIIYKLSKRQDGSRVRKVKTAYPCGKPKF